MTASHFLPLDGQHMPGIPFKPIEVIGGCHVPEFMEDKELREITYNQNQIMALPFPAKR